jgi:hypothetical protein
MQRPLQTTDRSVVYFRPSRRDVLVLAALSAAAFALAFFLRYGIMENTALGYACDAGDTSFACTVRFAVYYAFTYAVLGSVALIAACLQIWRPNLIAFGVALVFASFGLVLYNTRLSALAVTLLVLSLARARS